MIQDETGGPEGVPEHEIRSFLAETQGVEYVSYPSLEEAGSDPDAALVLSGDYGATIYLTAPVRLVGCDLGTLRTLVSDLDAVTWMSGDLTIQATVALERHPVGTGVMGGGGVVIDGVWIHPKCVPEDIHEQIREVVSGQRARVDVAILRRLRERELARKKEWRTAHPGKFELAWDFDVAPPAVPFDQ